MNHQRRGVALLINNIEFTDRERFKTRVGAEFDSESLRRVLGKLHFEVRLHQDKTQCEMRKLLEKVAHEDHSHADCFMCVVMSHGTKLEDGGLGVFGVDGEIIYIEAEAMSLFSTRKCPTLAKKPKLFFVDACWGGKGLETTSSFLSNSTDISCTNGSSCTTEFSINPDISDFLFSFSTLPNYVSLRDGDKGNWFIQEITSTLDKFAETRTLSDVMHKVRDKLMRKATVIVAQMSVDHWMLSRHVIFKSKNMKILRSSKTNTYLLYLQFHKINISCFNCKLLDSELANTFENLPLLTEIGQNGKFASLSSDLKDIQIWILLGIKREMLHVLSGHSHRVTTLHPFQTIDNNNNNNNQIKRMSALASGSEDGSIRIWNLKSGECLQFINGHEKKVVSLESICMSKLASSSLDGTVRVWDLSFHFAFLDSNISTEQSFVPVHVPQTIEQVPAQFALASDKIIRIYNAETGASIRQIQTEHPIVKLEYVGAHRIACGLKDCSIQIWNLKTFECKTIDNKLAFSNRGQLVWLHSFENLLAAVSRFKTTYFVDICDVDSSSHMRTVHISDKYCQCCTIALRNNLVAGCFMRGTIKLWNILNGECEYLVRDQFNNYRQSTVRFLDNDDMLMFRVDDQVSVWNVKTRALLSVKTIKDFQFVESRNLETLEEGRIAFYQRQSNTVQIHNLTSARKSLLSIWNSNGFERELVGHENEITALKWLGNAMIASGSKDSTIKVWRIDTGECLETLVGHANYIEVLIMFNEHRLASMGFNESFRVWNIDFKQQKQSRVFTDQEANEKKNKSYLFKTIGTKYLAIVYPDKISVCDVADDKPLPDLHYSSDNKDILGLLQSHGESTLIGAIGSIIIVWNVSTGERLFVLSDHLEKITALIVSHSTLISGSLDKTTRIWDLNTGICLQTINILLKYKLFQSYYHKSLITVATNQCLFQFDTDKNVLIENCTYDHPYSGLYNFPIDSFFE